MPFTPFHLGPGALLKAIGGPHFSFLIFSGSQVLMDIEPAVRIIRGDEVLHGVSHTVLGAVPIALVAAAFGRPICAWALQVAKIEPRSFSWAVALSSAFIGTFSHVGLDAIMHHDMSPLWPIARGNGLLGLIPLSTLHGLCVMSGILGAALIGLRPLLRTPN